MLPHRLPRRLPALMLSLSSLALLAACGGGGEEGGDGSFFTISANPDRTRGTFGSYYMASITQEWRDAAASFRNNNARFRFQNGTFNIGGNQIFANPLHSSRVDYAHALGLSGAGIIIAIVDDGFLRTHEALAGRIVTTTGSPGVEDHGTTVASIAAGNSGRMVGVAPGARMILSDWGNDSTADLTAAANVARTNGAVAQNNSWGFDGIFANSTNFNTFFVNDPQGAAWLTALRRYALGYQGWQGGVVVFAIDNDDNGQAGLMDGLPVLQSDLEKAWIAVGNAIPIFDDTGVSGVARLESSACYQSAAWCIMADGYWNAANAASNTSYAGGTGSSFAAPQVTGALALLAEAFPNLTPHQLRARLLASADNTFAGFVSAGAADLVDGPDEFLHNYSLEYGHGFLDIRAALLPIGQTVFATADGGSIKTQDFAFSSGGAMGDAISQSLDGIDLTAIDALGGGFSVAAKDFASEAAPVSLAETVSTRAFRKDYTAERTKTINPLARSFASHPGQTFELNDPEGKTKAAVLISGGDTYGVAVSRALTEGDLKLEVGVKVARDDGSLMGFSDRNGSGGADMAAVTLGLSHDLGQGGFFALSGEVGVADLGAPVALESVSSVGFNSVGLDIGSRGVFAKGDRLAFGVSMPVAVTSGDASMVVPVSTGAGLYEMRSVDIDLAPQERQVDISISYQVPMSERSEMLFEVVHAENYGNRAGLSDSAAIIGMKWSF